MITRKEIDDLYDWCLRNPVYALLAILATGLPPLAFTVVMGEFEEINYVYAFAWWYVVYYTACIVTGIVCEIASRMNSKLAIRK